MDRQAIPLRATARRFVHTVHSFANSDVGGKAKLMFVGLITLLFGITGMNVVNSYVGREFMTAIEHRDKAEFVQQAILYIGVFAASTLVAVIARFTEERLALLWRESLTQRALTRYLANGTYYRLDEADELANPDQRISEDVRAFTVTTLSFVLMLLNASFTVVAFSGVLWSISPLLFIVAVLYAACGSFLTIVLGRPLVTLNNDQFDKEANFRSSLIHVRENAEPIMLAHREEQLTAGLMRRLEELVSNFRRITAVNRNVGFFTTGYNWMIQIIPALIVAPAFISGTVEFGVITQSAMAFALLVGAFSLIVTQFQSISTFAAVVTRLSSLVEAVEKSQTATGSAINIDDTPEARLAYEGLTLLSTQGDAPMVKDLSVSIPRGTRVLLTGSNHAARAALFRATAGLATRATGSITRPALGQMLFVAQRPYIPKGTLRQILVHRPHDGETADERLLEVLRRLGLEQALARVSGLDIDRDWETELSLREQQLLALARVLLAAPQFVFLDRVSTTLGAAQFHEILSQLSESAITYVSNGESDEARDLYDAVLDLGEDGGWTWTREHAERIPNSVSDAGERR